MSCQEKRRITISATIREKRCTITIFALSPLPVLFSFSWGESMGEKESTRPDYFHILYEQPEKRRRGAGKLDENRPTPREIENPEVTPFIFVLFLAPFYGFLNGLKTAFT